MTSIDQQEMSASTAKLLIVVSVRTKGQASVRPVFRTTRWTLCSNVGKTVYLLSLIQIKTHVKTALFTAPSVREKLVSARSVRVVTSSKVKLGSVGKFVR